jgi:hypothetical protein
VFNARKINPGYFSIQKRNNQWKRYPRFGRLNATYTIEIDAAGHLQLRRNCRKVKKIMVTFYATSKAYTNDVSINGKVTQNHSDKNIKNRIKATKETINPIQY